MVLNGTCDWRWGVGTVPRKLEIDHRVLFSKVLSGAWDKRVAVSPVRY